MNEVDTKSAALNLYYLVDDFRSTKTFGELFIEITNNSFGLYIVYLQIYFRVFLNNSRDVTDFITKSYLLETEIKRKLVLLNKRFLVRFYLVTVHLTKKEKKQQNYCLI